VAKPARKRLQAIAKGRGRGERLIVPLAFEVAARISARPPAAFRTDPTQLANGLAELRAAIGADGVFVAGAGGMERDPAQLAASVEACRRLRATLADEAVLCAAVTGPATLAGALALAPAGAAEQLVASVQALCEAGADAIIVVEDVPVPAAEEAWADALTTAGNIARFHQGLAYLWQGEGPLPEPARLPLDEPSTAGLGLVTSDRVVPANYDIEALRQWVAACRG